LDAEIRKQQQLTSSQHAWCAGVNLDFLTRGDISVVLGGGRVRAEDLNLGAILMYIVSMISSIWNTDNNLT